jgi:hypothetical protein
MYRKTFWIILTVLALLALTTTVAWAAPPSQDEITTDPLWTALTPLLAIATAIERLLERFWERWEKGAPPKKGEKYTWRDFLAVGPNVKGVPDTKAPAYKEFKKARAHWLGTIIALFAIALTNVRLFRLLNLDVGLLFSAGQPLFNLGIGGIFDDFTVGTLIDWVMTAIIVGWGGTELTHSILVGLVKGRQLWEETQAVQAGQKSLLDVQFVKDIIGPELDKMGLSLASLRTAFTALDKIGVKPDQIITNMVTGKAEKFLQEQGEAGQALLKLLEGDVTSPACDPVDLGKLLDKIAPDARKQFLGA